MDPVTLIIYPQVGLCRCRPRRHEEMPGDQVMITIVGKMVVEPTQFEKYYIVPNWVHLPQTSVGKKVVKYLSVPPVTGFLFPSCLSLDSPGGGSY